VRHSRLSHDVRNNLNSIRHGGCPWLDFQSLGIAFLFTPPSVSWFCFSYAFAFGFAFACAVVGPAFRSRPFSIAAFPPLTIHRTVCLERPCSAASSIAIPPSFFFFLFVVAGLQTRSFLFAFLFAFASAPPLQRGIIDRYSALVLFLSFCSGGSSDPFFSLFCLTLA
jgi:hypothetical protein